MRFILNNLQEAKEEKARKHLLILEIFSRNNFYLELHKFLDSELEREIDSFYQLYTFAFKQEPYIGALEANLPLFTEIYQFYKMHLELIDQLSPNLWQLRTSVESEIYSGLWICQLFLGKALKSLKSLLRLESLAKVSCSSLDILAKRYHAATIQDLGKPKELSVPGSADNPSAS